MKKIYENSETANIELDFTSGVYVLAVNTGDGHYITKKLFKSFIPKLLLIKRRKLRHNTYESAYCFYQKNELVKNGLKRNIINAKSN